MLPAQLLCAGREQEEFSKVAIQNRQLSQLPLVEGGGHVCSICLQRKLLRFGGYRDLLAHLADLQGDVYVGRDVSPHVNLLVRRFVSLGFNLDTVPSRNQVGDG